MKTEKTLTRKQRIKRIQKHFPEVSLSLASDDTLKTYETGVKIREFTEKVKSGNKSARRKAKKLLVDAGIVTKTGKLAKMYRSEPEKRHPKTNAAKKLILKIAKQYDTVVEFFEDNKKKYKDFSRRNNSYCIGGDILIGEYDNPEYMLISFFHEIGHTLIEDNFSEKWDYSTLMIEIECWNIGLETARVNGIIFSDDAIKWGFDQAMTYVGNDERERRDWKKTTLPKLIMSKLK